MVAAVVFVASALPGTAHAVDAVEQIDVYDPAGYFFTVDFEGNYLPNVVKRENGAASFEALKAQAVAARTYAYYKLNRGDGYLINSQADQVYSYGGVAGDPGGVWAQAVRETEGEVLSFNNVAVASFYVAGAIPSSPTAVPTAAEVQADVERTNTERYVTYTRNNNLTGRYNTGTSLGYLGTYSNPNYANRGAMSQNGADMLSDQGAHYYDILKFYYGGDIQLGVVSQPASHTPFGRKTLASFERNDEFFGRAATYSGQTRNLGAQTSVSRTTSYAASGSGYSQKIVFDYDGQSDTQDGQVDGFFSRHLSGAALSQRQTNLTSGTITTPVADPVGNIIFETTGTIGFWLLAEASAATADMQVGIAIDDFGASTYLNQTTEESYFLDVIADGQWHEYAWSLDDEASWSSAFGGAGDGQLNQRFTLDSILFRGFGDAVVYLDDVFYDRLGTVPEPTTLGLIVAMIGLCPMRGLRSREVA